MIFPVQLRHSVMLFARATVLWLHRYTEPLEMVGRMGEALMPKGSRRAEFRDRIKRNFATGMEETKAAARQIGSGLLSAEQNPYVNKSVAEAKADVPLLEKQIAEEEKAFRAAGGDPELVGQEWSIEPLPELRGQSQKIGGLRRRLAQARETATGTTTESFAGALSRSAEDIAQANRDRKAEIIKEYEPLINKAHDKELWMQVADSLGSSGPSMVGSMINPLFGLGLMYAQTLRRPAPSFWKKAAIPRRLMNTGTRRLRSRRRWRFLVSFLLRGLPRVRSSGLSRKVILPRGRNG